MEGSLALWRGAPGGLDVRQDVRSAAGIRVVLMPVGGIPEDKFEAFASIVRSFSVIELNQITADHSDLDKTLLQYKSWEDGEVRMNFLSREEGQRSEWEELQAYRRVYGVIGVSFCPKSPDLSVAYRDFTASLASFPTAVAVRCLAFEPLHDQPDLTNLPNLIMVPNADPEKLAFYVGTLLCDFAAAMMNKLEKMMANAEQTAGTLSTPLDSSMTAEDVQKLRKRRPARLAKRLGDLALLCSSPMDARVHFAASAEAARANADWTWLAASLEGAVAADLLVARQNGTAASPQEVVDRLKEAVANYGRKGVTALELEAVFKLARFYGELGRRLDCLEAVAHAYELARPLPVPDQTAVVAEAASVCEAAGCRRKFAFYARLAALLYQSKSQHEAAHVLELLAAAQLRLGDLLPAMLGLGAASVAFTPTHEAKGKAANRQLVARKGYPLGWPALQLQVLDELMTIAEWMNDHARAGVYGSYLLKKLGPPLDPLVQSAVAHRLFALVGGGGQPAALEEGPRLDLTGFPLLLSCRPLPLPPHLAPVRRDLPPGVSDPSALAAPGDDEERASSPFLFTNIDLSAHPGKKKKAQRKHPEVRWVSGELVEVEVLLSNPFAFDLHVDAVSLRTDGVPFECYPASAVLPARTKSRPVVVEGRPLLPGPAAGTLWVRGVVTRVLGITAFHPVSPAGAGLSLEEAAALPAASEPADADTAVAVLPPMPRLSLAAAVPAGLDLALYDGESHLAALHLENAGPEPVTHLSVSCSFGPAAPGPAPAPPAPPAGRPKPPPRGLSFDDPRVGALLPLRRGEAMELVVSLRAPAGSPAGPATVRVQYGSLATGVAGGGLSVREATCALAPRPAPALSLVGCDVIPAGLAPSALHVSAPALPVPRAPSGGDSRPPRPHPYPFLASPPLGAGRSAEESDCALLALDVRNGGTGPFHLSCSLRPAYGAGDESARPAAPAEGLSLLSVSRSPRQPSKPAPGKPEASAGPPEAGPGVVVDADMTVRLLVPVERAWLLASASQARAEIERERRAQAEWDAVYAPKRPRAEPNLSPAERRSADFLAAARRVLARSIRLAWRSVQGTAGAVRLEGPGGGLALLSADAAARLVPEPLRVRCTLETVRATATPRTAKRAPRTLTLPANGGEPEPAPRPVVDCALAGVGPAESAASEGGPAAPPSPPASPERPAEALPPATSWSGAHRPAPYVEHARCALRRFYRVGFEVGNRSGRPAALHASIVPALLSSADTTADLGRCLAWVGSLEQRLPPIPPGGTHTLHVTLCFLATGTYRLSLACDEEEAPAGEEGEGAPRVQFRAPRPLEIEAYDAA